VGDALRPFAVEFNRLPIKPQVIQQAIASATRPLLTVPARSRVRSSVVMPTRRELAPHQSDSHFKDNKGLWRINQQ
jgi:hypothetical protein